MNYYQESIIKATKCSPDDAEEIESYMRDIIFHSTLDWQTRAQFVKGARDAWNDIQFMRSPDGIAYMATL